jgi:hypothetical protein
MFLNPKFKIFVAPTQQLLSHHKVKQFLKVYANIFPFTPMFERLLVLHKVHKREWALRLIPLLTGKALETFSRLSEEDSVEYEKSKLIQTLP